MNRSKVPPKQRLNKVRVALAAFALVLLASIPVICLSSRKSTGIAPFHQTPNVVRPVVAKLTPAHMARPVFQYSIVPGGVRSAVEAESAVNRDPVVRDHYRGVRADALTPFNLDKDTLAYVSYRMNGKVFWTQKKLQLHKGELLLTDGKTMIRGRCGNRISMSQMPSAAGPEPPETVFDVVEQPPTPAVAPAPLVAAVTPVNTPAVIVPATPAVAAHNVAPIEHIASKRGLALLVPAALVGTAIAGVSSNHHTTSDAPPPPPVTVAPEPVAYAWLLALGFAWLFVRSRRKSVRQS